ncbi:hypothetical protein O3G_MSEX004228 [Manduca sexta]|uniref:Kazal-like domain-containing protein n=1 Tax=Manduca sexta TaxID=7130 RepID=A0A922CGK9_MANSE|nr:hypothetical protein O3G_MSEX004228 [Manduca sexta]
MLYGKVLLCVVIVAAWCEAESASLPFIPSRLGTLQESKLGDLQEFSGGMRPPGELTRARVREGVPPPLCAGRCVSPPAGPVCAFDAAGTARTFATLCELEAASCRESTYYAITSIGEC